MTKEKKEVFLRKASGLVRTFSATDAFAICAINPGMYWPFVYMLYAHLLYPATDMRATVPLAFIMMLPLAFSYIFLSIAMPRSGGDYVYVGRILHPAVGFMSNFFLTAMFFLWGYTQAWVFTYAIGPMFKQFAMVTGNAAYETTATWFMNTNNAFILATILLLICYLLLIRPKVAARTVIFTLVVSVIGMIAWLIAMGGVGQAGFAARFNQVSGMSYQGVIDAAKTGGIIVPVTLTGIFMGTTYTMLNFTNFNISAYFAGEIKGVEKSQLIAILGALVFNAAIFFVIYALIYNVAGVDFLKGIARMYTSGDPNYTLGVEPAGHYLTVFATDNLALIALVNIGFAFSAFGAYLTCIIVATRNMFAWSFDRIIPTKIAEVDRRFHSPYITLIIGFFCSMIGLYLFMYTTLLSYFTYLMFGWWGVSMLLVGIAAAVFPYRRKDIFEAAPGIVKTRIAGIPAVTIAGVLMAIFSVILAIFSALPTLTEAITWNFMYVVVGTLVIGLIIYYGSYFYQKSKGVPIDLAHSEIPPE